MKKTMIVLALLAATAIPTMRAAQAQNCTTTCNRIGNFTNCSTNCW